jgi:hypothetical protein
MRCHLSIPTDAARRDSATVEPYHARTNRRIALSISDADATRKPTEHPGWYRNLIEIHHYCDLSDHDGENSDVVNAVISGAVPVVWVVGVVFGLGGYRWSR